MREMRVLVYGVVLIFLLVFSSINYADPNDPDPIPILPTGEMPTPPDFVVSAPVGNTPSGLSVNPSGDAVYTVPIQVAPGRAGLAPNLSLLYNSNGADGYVGIKWSLSGASSMIQRCGSTYAEDGIVRRVQFDNEDHLCMDGSRLVLINGTHLTSGAEYRTQAESFQRIIYYENTNSYFIIETKDGRFMRYGCDITSDDVCMTSMVHAYRADTGAAAISGWAVSKAWDTNGNYMTYEYSQERNGTDEALARGSEDLQETVEFLPKRISYTGNNAISPEVLPDARVEFTYSDTIRTTMGNVRHGFSAGNRTLMKQLLTNIDVYVDGSDKVRGYELEYEASNTSNEPRLISITETDGNDSAPVSKPPLRFEWNDENVGYEEAEDTGLMVPQTTRGIPQVWDIPNTVISADLNGDGYMDIVYPNTTGTSAKWYFVLNDGTGFHAANVVDTGISISEPYSSDEYESPYGVPFRWDQDDSDEILLMLTSSTWEILQYNGSNLELVDTGMPVAMGNYYYDFEHKIEATYIVDLNGDGMDDMLFCQQSAIDSAIRNWVYYLHSFDSGFGPEQMIGDLSGSWASAFNDPKNVLIMDYNGDGATDLLINGSRDGAPPTARYDVFYFNEGADSKGVTNLPYFDVYQYHGLTKVMDINGDGLSDVLYVIGDPNGCSEGLCPYSSSMWINTGEGFLGGDTGFPAIPFDGFNIRYYNVMFNTMPMDYNKDGVLDLVMANVERYSGSFANMPRYEGEWKIYRGRGGFVADNVSDGWGGTTHEGFYDEESLGMDFYDYAYKVRYPLVMDLNGDLLPDLLMMQENREREASEIEATYMQMRRHRYGHGDYIVRIRDGLIGIDPEHAQWDSTFTYQIQYKPTTDSSVYEQDFDTSIMDPSPGIGYFLCGSYMGRYRSCRAPFKMVVSSIVSDSAAHDNQPTVSPGNLVETTYQYRSSAIDNKWGWLGFGQMIKTNESTQTISVTEYDNWTYNDTLMRYLNQGLVRQQCSQTLLTGGALKTCTENHYWYKRTPISNYLTYWVYPTGGMSRKKWVNGGASTTLSSSLHTLEWDDYGNRIWESSNQSLEDHESTTATQYMFNDIFWLGTPMMVTVQDQQGSNIKTQRMEYSYELPDRRLITKMVKQSGDSSLELTTKLSYNDFGNVVRTEVFDAAMLENRVTLTTYDEEGLFPIRIVNPLGHVVESLYDRGLGVKREDRDSNNLVSKYTYDYFGRMVESEGPTGAKAHISFSTYDSGSGRMRLQVSSYTDGGPLSVQKMDRMGRVVDAETAGFDGENMVSTKTYNTLGQLSRIEHPVDGAVFYQEMTYDHLGRVVQTVLSDGTTTSTQYDDVNKRVISQDPRGKSTTSYYNGLGQTWKVVDSDNKELVYIYGPFNTVKMINHGMGQFTWITTDDYGQVIQQTDPDTGTSMTTYNAYGEITQTVDNMGNSVTMSYDKLGRTTSRNSMLDGVSTYTYDDIEAGGLYGVSTSNKSPWNHEVHYKFDNNTGQLIQKNTIIEGKEFAESFMYDSYGRVQRHYFPEALGEEFALKYDYLGGYLYQIEDYFSATKFWELKDSDGMGRTRKVTLGNGVDQEIHYDALSGNMTELKTVDGSTDLQDISYIYDPNRNILNQQEHVRGVTESFTYDDLNRLVESNMSGPNLFETPEGVTIPITEADYHITYTYDELGNILTKSNTGSYSYDGMGPHAVTKVVKDGTAQYYSYDMVGNQVTRPDETINYTSFRKPRYITKMGGGMLEYQYDADGNRVLARVNSTAGVTSNFYVGGYEKQEDADGKERHRYYVGGVAVVTKTMDGESVNKQTVYLHNDHLGSVNLITDEDRQVKERLFYDAFGQRRDYHWGGPVSMIASSDYTSGGFTGHMPDDEDIDIKLIHMGGREYDPNLGRFLSADPIVQAPFNKQSLNRYSYVWNNPINATDPSGYKSKTGKEFWDCGDGSTCSDDYYVEVRAQVLKGNTVVRPRSYSLGDRLANFFYSPDSTFSTRGFMNRAGRAVAHAWNRVSSASFGQPFRQAAGWLANRIVRGTSANFFFGHEEALPNILSDLGAFIRDLPEDVHVLLILFPDGLGGFVEGGALAIPLVAGLSRAERAVPLFRGVEEAAPTIDAALRNGRNVVVNSGCAGATNARLIALRHPEALIVHVDIDGWAVRTASRSASPIHTGGVGEHIVVQADVRALVARYEGQLGDVYVLFPSAEEVVAASPRLVGPGRTYTQIMDSAYGNTLGYGYMLPIMQGMNYRTLEFIHANSPIARELSVGNVHRPFSGGIRGVR